MPEQIFMQISDGKAQLSTPETEKTISKENPLVTPDEKMKLLFEDFWKAYPRKVNKQGAYKAFKNIKHIEKILPDILADLEVKRNSKDWQKDNGQYIPHPTTYLHQERWNDSNEVAEKQAAINNIISESVDGFYFN